MKITKIELYKIKLQLVSPWRTAYGEDAFNEPVLVKMYSGKNYGWGEASPLKYPTYSPEFTDGVYNLASELIAPFLIGKDLDSGEELQQKLSWIKGNNFAKGAFDQAWWDMAGRMCKKPLWRMFGGTSASFTRGDDYGIQDSYDILLEKIAGSVRRGVPRVKLKFGRGWDVPMLKTVREHFPLLTLHIDCNSSFTLADTEMFKAIDEFNLAMIEQPLAYDDLLDHAKLQKIIKTPICLDESLTSINKARKAIELQSCRYFNLKPGRVGGNTNLLAINTLAKAASIPCWIGGMLESSVGKSHCFHLATLPNMTYPADVTEYLYKNNLGVENPEHLPVSIQLSDAAGIGFEPSTAVLQDVCTDQTIIGG